MSRIELKLASSFAIMISHICSVKGTMYDMKTTQFSVIIVKEIKYLEMLFLQIKSEH